MIGCYIKGTDNTGKQCEGMVLDKVLVLQAVEMKQPGVIGGGQSMPIPLDAYLVFNQDKASIHLVNPQMISAISVPEAVVPEATPHRDSANNYYFDSSKLKVGQYYDLFICYDNVKSNCTGFYTGGPEFNFEIQDFPNVPYIIAKLNEIVVLKKHIGRVVIP